MERTVQHRRGGQAGARSQAPPAGRDRRARLGHRRPSAPEWRLARDRPTRTHAVALAAELRALNAEHLRSTATLRDLATLATAVHAHTGAHHATPDDPASRTVTLLYARAKAWQQTALDLADYLTPAPRHREAHDEIRATVRVLGQLAPLPPRSAPVADKEPAVREQETAVLRSAVATTEKVQDWAAQIFGRLADDTDLYVPAHALTGAQVTDDPELVRVKLTGSRTPAPPARTAQTIECYRSALPPGSSLSPRASTSGIEQNLEPMVIASAHR